EQTVWIIRIVLRGSKWARCSKRSRGWHHTNCSRLIWPLVGKQRILLRRCRLRDDLRNNLPSAGICDWSERRLDRSRLLLRQLARRHSHGRKILRKWLFNGLRKRRLLLGGIINRRRLRDRS